MYIYFFAGAFLLVAIVFVIKYFIDNRKMKTEPTASDKSDLTIITDDDEKNKLKSSKTKRDFIFALIFMVLCEVCILLGNYVIKI